MDGEPEAREHNNLFWVGKKEKRKGRRKNKRKDRKKVKDGWNAVSDLYASFLFVCFSLFFTPEYQKDGEVPCHKMGSSSVFQVGKEKRKGLREKEEK